MNQEQLREEYYRLFDVTDEAEKKRALESLRGQAKSKRWARWVRLIDARLQAIDKHYPEALATLEPLLAENNDDLDAVFLKGVVQRFSGANDEAIDSLGRAIGLARKQEDHVVLRLAQVRRGFAYGQRGGEGDRDRAIADYTAVIDMPDAPAEPKAKALFNRGVTYGQRGGEGDAQREIADFTAVIEMPDAPAEQKAKALFCRGITYGQRGGEGDYDLAIADFTAVIDMPNAPAEQKAKALVNRGNRYGQRGGEGDRDRAIADHTAVIDMPDAPAEQKAKALVNRGATYGQRGGEGDYDRAIADFTAVIDMPDAPAEKKANALVNRGITYGKRGGEGDYDRAIADFTAVIDMPDAPAEKKANALVSRGITYGKRGGEGDREREIADYTAVIEMPDAPAEPKAKALVNRGVTYGKRGGEGDYDRAIADFTAVIDMPDAPAEQKANALVNRGITYGQRGGEGDRERAIADCAAVVELGDACPKHLLRPAQARLESYRRLAAKKRAPAPSEPTAAAEPQLRDKDVLEEDIERVELQDIFSQFTPEEVDRYEKGMQELNKTDRDFLSPKTDFADRSILVILRQWNSYTPALPMTSAQDVGGGYFLRHRGQGIVIDPGFGFLRLFHEAGGRIHDVDHVVITHAHPDHTAELETLFMLLREYRKGQNPEPTGRPASKRRLRLYLSQDAQRKFSPLLDVWNSMISEVVTLNRGHKRSPAIRICGGCSVTPLAAYHKDPITKGYAVGLGFHLTGEKEWGRYIVFTADTGLFPPGSKGENRWEKRISSQYPNRFQSPDLLVAHIGSVDGKEFETLRDSFAKMDSAEIANRERRHGRGQKPAEIGFYAMHLGLFGTYLVTKELRPKLALVSEFGKEMRNIRVRVVQKLETALSNAASDENERTHMFCADPHFVYDIEDRRLLCHETREFVDPAQLEMDDLCRPGARDESDDCAVYLFRNDQITPLLTRERELRIKEFHKALADRKFDYFTDDARKRKKPPDSAPSPAPPG